MKPDAEFSLFWVQEIADNCEMITQRIDEFSMTQESYARSPLYQDMLTMPMIRACEVVKLYREDLAHLYPDYDWRSVGAMRDKMAHPYGGFDYSFVWDAAVADIPELLAICREMLATET